MAIHPDIKSHTATASGNEIRQTYNNLPKGFLPGIIGLNELEKVTIFNLNSYHDKKAGIVYQLYELLPEGGKWNNWQSIDALTKLSLITLSDRSPVAEKFNQMGNVNDFSTVQAAGFFIRVLGKNHINHGHVNRVFWSDTRLARSLSIPRVRHFSIVLRDVIA